MPDLDRLVEILRTDVAVAEEPFDTVVWQGVDYLTYAEEERGDLDEAAVERTVWDLTDSLFAEHLAAQDGWAAYTDSDRLTAAFHELGRTRVAARENFTCCQNCGHTEILDGYKPGERPRGYLFYHQQDADRGVAGEGVYLAYGAPGDQEAFAGEVVEALRGKGLQPQWNGSSGSRVFVPLTWQRRRTGRLAAYPGSIGAPDFTVDVKPIGWKGPKALAGGRQSARAWAALRLPWLPNGARVRLTAGKRKIVVRREWDRLVDDQGNSAARHDAWALVSALAGPPSPPAGAAEPAMLEVEHNQRDIASDGRLPMTLAECRWLLRYAPVFPGAFTIYTSRSGSVVQHMWNADGTLWLEYLDSDAQASRGRLATTEEVDRVIIALAEDDRVILDDLGPLETSAW